MQDLLSFFENLTSSDFVGAIITAIIIVIATFVCVEVATRFIRRIATHEGNSLPSSTIFVNLARAAIWLAGLSLMLSTCFGVNVSALITALGVGGLAISLGFSDTISNLIGGLQVSIMSIVAPGDNISVGSLKGVVHDVTWRQTVLCTDDDRVIVIPNSVINSQIVVKYAPYKLVRIPVSLAMDGRDMNEVAKEIEERAFVAASNVGTVIQKPRLILSNISELGMNGVIKYEMELDESITDATDAIIRAIAPYTRNSLKDAAEQERVTSEEVSA